MALASKLFAPHYAAPVSRKVGPSGGALNLAAADGGTLAELEPGEEFALVDISGGWAWGYRTSDHLVGYVRVDALSE